MSDNKMSEPPNNPVLIQWILDTRSWFPSAAKTRDLEVHASRPLSLLTPTERASVLKYFHVRDARMALASALLKRYAIARLAGVAWSSTTPGFTRDERTTKPIWRDPATGAQPVAFNVSHQAGIVALVAVADYPGPGAQSEAGAKVEVGVDVVCTSERRDRDQDLIRKEGWGSFVDMHADVFAMGETSYLKYQVLSAVPGLVERGGGGGPPTPEQVADGKLRAFYALWALREAYVKLTGEALLAEWLGELEFRYFRPSRPTPAWDVPAVETKEGEEEGEDAQVLRKFEIRFRGKKVEDVNMCLRSMGPDYMVATAVRTPEDTNVGLRWRLGPYETLALDDLLNFADSAV
ncbi:uncharacterized protein B0T23DRAFT_89141 [Neurospora hispaniola]|uniref:holo-[acyl-carrier-protein] synthase n=1 Tax=Neurospora hispaniola TaxID=588809 RepID=A0AAJ0IDG6_9PEZI|nr:hypothetical protein B0T23DRAFT_89141 [Neurospora hispaniola]